MRPEQYRLAGFQGVITIIGATGSYVFVSPWAAESAAFGGCVAIIGALFLGWRFVAGASGEHLGAEWILRHAYRTALERFVLVAALLAIGFEVLKLSPFWMLAGFIGGQLAWLAVPVWMRLKKQK